jgi:hypothetical protein
MTEWPTANQNPTDLGLEPSAVSLRVVLSMAAMWSGSKAWRRPKVYAVRPSPMPKTGADLIVMRGDEHEQRSEADQMQDEDRGSQCAELPPVPAVP